jgi:hypothetical protein
LRVDGFSVTDDELLSRAPDDRADAAAQLRRGVTLQALGYLERSLPPLRRATLLAPTDPNPWFQIAIGFSGTGRAEQVEAVGPVLRELSPSRSDMWFEVERDEALRPFARFTRAAFLAFEGENEAFEAASRSVIEDYRDSSLARVQTTVALAETGLAQLLSLRGDPSRARSVLDGIITRLGPSADARARLIVAMRLSGAAACRRRRATWKAPWPLGRRYATPTARTRRRRSRSREHSAPSARSRPAGRATKRSPRSRRAGERPPSQS